MRTPDTIIKAVHGMCDKESAHDLKVYLFMALWLSLNQEAQAFTHSQVLSSFMHLRTTLAFAAVSASTEPARLLSTSLFAEGDGTTFPAARRYINIAALLYSMDPNLIVHRMIYALQQADLVKEYRGMSVVEYRLNERGVAAFTEIQELCELK